MVTTGIAPFGATCHCRQANAGLKCPVWEDEASFLDEPLSSCLATMTSKLVLNVWMKKFPTVLCFLCSGEKPGSRKERGTLVQFHYEDFLRNHFKSRQF